MKQKLTKALHIVVDILIVLVLVVSILVLTLSLTSKSDKGVPHIFGYAPLTVQSDSMSGTFEKGDLIICKVTDSYTEYGEGDIVTFPVEIEGVQTFNTHRIVDVIEDNDITFYQTQGDNKVTNNIPDDELQNSGTIVAKFTGTVLPNVGNFVNFLRTQFGFFICVLLPMILFFVYEAIRVIMNIIAYNKEKAVAAAQEAVANAELSEEQKQKAIAEYLASLEGAKEQESVQTPADSENE